MILLRMSVILVELVFCYSMYPTEPFTSGMVFGFAVLDILNTYFQLTSKGTGGAR